MREKEKKGGGRKGEREIGKGKREMSISSPIHTSSWDVHPRSSPSAHLGRGDPALFPLMESTTQNTDCQSHFPPCSR